MTAMANHAGRPFGNNVTLCPHCGHRCHSLNADQISPTYREIRYACSNDACRHIFIAAITPVRTLVESRVPAAGVIIPIRPPVKSTDTANDPNQLDIFTADSGPDSGPNG